ncbi:MAG TPA: histidine kinase dimerization/phospho-acceptor domain-containing protein, partial [Gemmatimonadaceae bacterium]|nr:histidine kinase dimerization/phospho-acceptor domain-containing protein [Gemmatimonadaceae bacterium]
MSPKRAGAFVAPTIMPSRVTPSHVVQFYEHERHLSVVVADFLLAGLAAGQPTVVMATESHRRAFARRVRTSGPCVWLDAREMLGTFMVGATPDRERFRAAIGGVLERSLQQSGQDTVWTYGEMVDVLWKDGNVEGALRVEELWNELALTHRFVLLCAYGIGNFSKASDAGDMARLCQAHGRVVPTETYTEFDEASGLREIALLQQQARALKTEIADRVALEGQLRDALAREQEARVEAEAAVRAKSDFLTIMSHELRTPLNAIGGYVQLVEMGVHGGLTDAQRDALARVQRSQRHLLSLINQVLNLARIEGGHVEYELESVALGPLVADIQLIVEPMLLAKALTCESTPEASLVVRADCEKLQQILLNLLSNAIKFTPAGGRIVIDAAACPGVPAMVAIRVRDTGIGIPLGKLDGIFAPFVQ